MSRFTQARRLLTGLVVGATTASAWAVALPAPAQAADAAAAPAQPATVSADALPTVQINGVVWDQVIVGNTVYVGGEFTNARPAGAAPGVNTVPRSNLLAYDIRTGQLVTSWAPTVEGGKVVDLAVSPDGTKLGVVGNFTKVNGVNRYRSAVFNLPTGTLSNVSASLDAPAQSVAMSNTTMYVGGYFSRIGSTPRPRIGAISLTNGAVQPFTVPVDNNQVLALALSPDASQLVLAGNFTSVGGSANPGYGLYRADATTGAGLPLPVNTEIRNAGTEAAILKLDSDADSFYGVGYHFGRAGNTEGTFRASWADGSLVNLEDCHGDTYDVAAGASGVVYKASHKHYCGNSGGFPQTEPWTFWHSTAWTKETRGTNTADIYGYPDHPGTPRPELLPFYPQTDVGTYTGKSQATWSVKANDQYVVFGGEFPRVNGQQQQGLVRYAVRSIAPNKQGPRPTTTAPWTANVQSFRRGEVRVTWPTLWDYDDTRLTYRVWRQSAGNVVDEVTADTTQWNVKTLTFNDTSLAPGTSTRYYVEASDPSGNTYGTGWTDVTVAATDTISPYGAAVIDDGATKYWPLNEPAGSTVVTDYAGTDDTVSGPEVTRGVGGAMTNSADAASTFTGTANGRVYSAEAIDGPNTFSQEVWFRTTTTAGGKIAGFGNSTAGDSGSYDRHLYMDGAGRVFFGVYPNAVRTVSSGPGLNDGQWHQAVATLGANGMVLYVDGKRVASRADTTSGQSYRGYWRIGGDNLGGWASGNAFAGSIDDYSVFPTVLTAKQVDRHWQASGRASALPPRPTDALGAAVYDSEPDLYWRLEETSGSVAADAATGSSPGTYRGAVTLGRPALLGRKAVSPSSSPWGTVTGTTPVSNPTEFSQEIWIKTTTQRGGRIFGFGDNPNGDWSSNYDRMMWMRNDGTVRWGIWSGRENTIDTTRALNDGQWHQVVTTFDRTNGMRLYVDGELDGTNPNTVAQDYTGYWRIGPDNFWGGSDDVGFTGDVDEVAVFPRALTPAEARRHFQAGTGVVVNTPPSAAFTSQVDDLSVSVDGSGSSDPDGSVASYSWSWGDGSPDGSGRTASHTYAAAGTYTVTLTVTDAGGATDVESAQVSVVKPNVAPTAAFSQSADDFRVAFDGRASTDADGSLVSYAWDFGDGSTGSGATVSHDFATAGTYAVRLTVTDDRGASDSVTKQVSVVAANVAPAAAFTVSASGLDVSVDGSGSSDPDGSVASYSWSWGDGTADGSGRTASHSYASAGEKTVTLTVTDDRGATASTTRTVTVSRTNVAPSASFTTAVSGLGVSVDGSGSSDPDGSVASYSWSWGDGTADGSGRTASHSYASAGEKTVTLTVTDDRGATASTTRTVTVTAPAQPGVLARDGFDRTASGSWGSAEVGGAWSVLGGNARFSVGQGAGVMSVLSGQSLDAELGSLSETAGVVTTQFSVDKLAEGQYVGVRGRKVGANTYNTRIRIAADGSARMWLLRNNDTALASVFNLPFAITPGVKYSVKMSVSGTSPTSLAAKVWPSSMPEPAQWQRTASDSSVGLQAAGTVGVYTWLPSSAAASSPVRVAFDSFEVASPGSEGGPAANVAPSASFTTAVSGLGVSVDGSGSSDPDGSVASYSWSWGDGTADGSGRTASHSYASAGEKTVTLTVTDDRGATASTTRTVTVTAPAQPGVLARDGFDRTASGSWGSAEVGGAWSVLGGNARFSVGQGAGVMSVLSGQSLDAELGSLSETAGVVTTQFSVDKLAEGQYVGVRGRKVGANTYNTRIRIAADGSARMWLLRNNDTALASVFNLPFAITPGVKYSVKMSVSGTSPTSLAAKVWPSSMPEPAQWQRTASDSSVGLQAAGTVGVYTWLPSSAAASSPVRVAFDSFEVARAE